MIFEPNHLFFFVLRLTFSLFKHVVMAWVGILIPMLIKKKERKQINDMLFMVINFSLFGARARY